MSRFDVALYIVVNCFNKNGFYVACHDKCGILETT